MMLLPSHRKEFLLNSYRFGGSGAPQPPVAPPMSAGLKTGLVHYYKLDNNGIDSVNPTSQPDVAVIEPTLGWDFNGHNSGFTLPAGSTATLSAPTATSSTVVVTSTGADPYLQSPALNPVKAGSTFRYVHIRLKRLTAGAFEGIIYYTTAGHGISASFYKTVADPTGGVVDGLFYTIVADMHTLTVGGTDWSTNNIIQVRFDTSNATGVNFEIDYIVLSDSATSRADWAQFGIADIHGQKVNFSNSGYITLRDAVGLNTAQTVAAWCTGAGVIYAKGTDGAGGGGWGVSFSDTATVLTASIVTTSPAVTNYVAQMNHGIAALTTPRLYIMEFDNTGTIKVSVNAGTQTSTATGTTLRGTGFVTLGGSRLGTLTFDSFRNGGSLDEVGFWNRVLTAAERTELYNGGAGRTF